MLWRRSTLYTLPADLSRTHVHAICYRNSAHGLASVLCWRWDRGRLTPGGSGRERVDDGAGKRRDGRDTAASGSADEHHSGTRAHHALALGSLPTPPHGAVPTAARGAVEFGGGPAQFGT
eukprot:3583720-Rhodomonas_salina.9